MTGIIIFAGMLAFAAVLLVRTVLFVPPEIKKTADTQYAVDADKAAARLSQLIQKRTVSSRNESEVDLGQFDAFIELLPVLYPDVHRTVTREFVNGYAIVYRWKGRQPQEPIVLMSHYDVVAAASDGWKYPPFDGVIADGIIWGRGSIDTKVTLASILESAESLIKSGFVPDHDIYFSFTHNEELGGDGTPAIVKLFEQRGLTPGLVLDEGGAVVEHMFPGVSKPVAMVGVSEKGIIDLEFIVKSTGGHAATPPLKATTGKLARAIVRLEENPFASRFPRPTIEMLKTLGRHTPFGFRILFANLWLFKPLLLVAFTRHGGETNAICRTTIAMTMLQGSHAVNVMPSEVRSAASVRVAVGETIDATIQHIRRIIHDPSVELHTVFCREPSPVSDTKGEAYSRLSKAINETYPSAVVSPYIMLGGSDACHFAKISKNVFRFSPLELSKEERDSMHSVNESLPVAKLVKAVEFYLRLISMC